MIGFTFVLIVFCANFAFSENTLPQVKCVGTEINYSNPGFNQGWVVYMTTKNETYNYIHMYWNLLQDLSPDSILSIKVYATDEMFQGGELVLEITTPLCQPSETRELMPKVFAMEKSVPDQPCAKKGPTMIHDIGQFRFEVLIPNIRSKGKYFTTVYSLYQDAILQSILSAYNVLSE